MLKIENLRKYFGEVRAVDNVSLEMEAGVLTSIIGPNGAGKTTLINLITGRLIPDSGRVIFMGEDITKLPPHERVMRGIGRSFQIMSFFPALTVFENVQIPIISHMRQSLNLFSARSSLREVNERAVKILKDVGLLDKKDLPAKALSHGDQRLLEIAIAMGTEPKLLFLDEPTSGTNPIERAQVLNYIKTLAKEGRTTFVIIEHDMDVVFELSDRIIVMHKGKVIADGKPSEIKKDENVREVYLGGEVT